MRTIVVPLVAVAFAAALTAAADIKSTTRLQIASSGTPARSNVVTDARVLAMSNVFAGAFIAQQVDVPNYQAIYTISFDIQTREGIKADAYVVQYAVDAQGQSFVYLPGRGEPSYRGNVSTIIRDGHDGKWHRASAEWSAAIHPYLP